jgi:spore maturation protein CgeB
MEDSGLRILAAFAHFNWEDYNLQPGLEELGEVVRLRWPPYNQYEDDWHYSKKQDFNIKFLQAVKEVHEIAPIDVFFGYVSGRLLFPSTVRAIGLMGIPTVNMFLDDRTKFYGRLEPTGFAGMADIANTFTLCWTSTEDAVKLYESVGARVIYLPEGANPNIYKRMNIQFDIDVSFVGQCYGQRPKAIEYLQSKGLNVQAFGRGWSTGEIPVNELVKIYSRSRINLGFGTVGNSKDLFCLKGRDFEVPMSGGFYLTQYHPELENWFEIGKEIVCYHDLEDLSEKIRFYLDHSEEAEKIRQVAYEKFTREHTWVSRFRRVFKEIGLLNEQDKKVGSPKDLTAVNPAENNTLDKLLN